MTMGGYVLEGTSEEAENKKVCQSQPWHAQ